MTNSAFRKAGLLAHRPLQIAALCAALFVLTATPLPAEPAKVLSFSHFLFPGEGLERKVFQRFASEVARLSGNRLTLDIAGRGPAGKDPAKQFASVVSGESDIAFGLPGFTPAQFPRTLLMSAPGLFEDARSGTRKIWERMPLIAKDFERVKLLAMWINDPPILVTRTRPVRRFADIAGLKILTSDEGLARIVTAWGAVPVRLPAGQANAALASGRADGALVASSIIRRAKLFQVARYFTLNMPGPATVFYIVINRKAWNALSGEEQGWMTSASGPGLSREAALVLKSASLMGLDTLARTDAEEILLPDEEIVRFQAANETVMKPLIAELRKSDIDAAKILAPFIALRAGTRRTPSAQ